MAGEEPPEGREGHELGLMAEETGLGRVDAFGFPTPPDGCAI